MNPPSLFILLAESGATVVFGVLALVFAAVGCGGAYMLVN